MTPGRHVCIARRVPFSGGMLLTAGLSASGHLSFTEICSGPLPSAAGRRAELSKLTSADIDAAAEYSSFRDEGQAALAIDILCRSGLCTYADRGRLYRGIDACLASGSFDFRAVQEGSDG